MANRRRLNDDELHHYEDNIAILSHIIGALERLFHIVTLHVMDPDVRLVAQDELRETYERAHKARKRNISRMRTRKLEEKRRKREKREARNDA